MMTKLIWRVQPAPTGRYRSFEKRGWPDASYDDADESPAAMITSEDAYAPSRIKTGEHAELIVHIADWSIPPSFKWRQAKKRCKTLAEAKALAQAIIDANPTFRPRKPLP